MYSVTGDLEHELAKAVGHQIAMSGYVEVAKSDGTKSEGPAQLQGGGMARGVGPVPDARQTLIVAGEDK